MCKDCKGTTPTYKSKIRMLFVNLKDKNNPDLRQSVTAGDVPAQTFARMTSQVRLSYSLLLLAVNTFELTLSCSKWPLRNARRLTRKSRKSTYSTRLGRPTSRQKQTRSNAAGANRYWQLVTGPYCSHHSSSEKMSLPPSTNAER